MNTTSLLSTTLGASLSPRTLANESSSFTEAEMVHRAEEALQAALHQFASSSHESHSNDNDNDTNNANVVTNTARTAHVTEESSSVAWSLASASSHGNDVSQHDHYLKQATTNMSFLASVLNHNDKDSATNAVSGETSSGTNSLFDSNSTFPLPLSEAMDASSVAFATSAYMDANANAADQETHHLLDRALAAINTSLVPRLDVIKRTVDRQLSHAIHSQQSVRQQRPKPISASGTPRSRSFPSSSRSNNAHVNAASSLPSSYFMNASTTVSNNPYGLPSAEAAGMMFGSLESLDPHTLHQIHMQQQQQQQQQLALMHPTAHQQQEAVMMEQLSAQALLSAEASAHAGVQASNAMHLQFQCHWEHCDQLFTNMFDLIEHANIVHIGVGKSQYECRWMGCSRFGMVFKKRHKMSTHFRLHTGERPHICPFVECGRAFPRVDSLKLHMATHSSVRPHACPLFSCDKEYFHVRSLRKHLAAHVVAGDLSEADAKLICLVMLKCVPFPDAFLERVPLKAHVVEQATQVAFQALAHGNNVTEAQQELEGASSAVGSSYPSPNHRLLLGSQHGVGLPVVVSKPVSREEAFERDPTASVRLYLAKIGKLPRTPYRKTKHSNDLSSPPSLALDESVFTQVDDAPTVTELAADESVTTTVTPAATRPKRRGRPPGRSNKKGTPSKSAKRRRRSYESDEEEESVSEDDLWVEESQQSDANHPSPGVAAAAEALSRASHPSDDKDEAESSAAVGADTLPVVHNYSTRGASRKS